MVNLTIRRLSATIPDDKKWEFLDRLDELLAEYAGEDFEYDFRFE